jgi:hypothetical protein
MIEICVFMIVFPPVLLLCIRPPPSSAITQRSRQVFGFRDHVFCKKRGRNTSGYASLALHNNDVGVTFLIEQTRVNICAALGKKPGLIVIGVEL